MKKVPLQFIDEVIVRSPAYAYDSGKSQDEILALLKNDFFLEAIYIASPLLYDECLKLRAGLLTSDKEKNRVVNSLQRYLTRMTTRSTPFGLFSTCGVAHWMDAEHTTAFAHDSITRHTRLDMHLLYNLLTAVLQQPAVQQHVKYYPNSSRYRIGGEVRYIEYSYQHGLRRYRISGVAYNQHIEKIMRLSQPGSTQAELTHAIAAGGISPEQSSRFVADVINAQLLVSDFEVALTSDEDFVRQITRTLQRLHAASGSDTIQQLVDFFTGLSHDLSVLDANAVNPIAAYRDLLAKLKTYYPEIQETKAFHIDAYRLQTGIRLDARIQNDLLELLEFLKHLNAGEYDTDDTLEAFKRAFVDRYESQTMPLVDVLDQDFGIGFPVHKKAESAILVDDIPVHVKVRDSTLRLSAKDKWLLSVLHDYRNKDATVIDLAEQRIPTYNTDESYRGLPATLSAMFRLPDSDAASILFEGFFGPSAASILGRFAHGNREIHATVEKIAAAEEQLLTNCALAEIVHMPDNRITNIIKHPAFRRYEIPYLAKPAVDEYHTIAIDDLFVRVENNEVILFSQRLNKRVIPCKTHMHNNIQNTLPIYHFLGSLQSQGMNRSINFVWGNVMQLFTYFPRICYKRIVVSPAMWILNASVFKSLAATAADRLSFAARLRSEFKIPGKVLHSESDNELLVDFSNALSVETWLLLVKNKPSVLLKEFLWAREDSESEHLHQYIATLVNTEAISFSAPVPPYGANITGGVTRDFALGSEWLYLKMYCGTGSVDLLLTKLIAPVTEQLVVQGLITEWFYIKYRDPEFHIRLRVRLTDEADALRVYQFISHHVAASTMQPLIWKIQLDTYHRELERYGANTMALCETLFWLDSRAATSLLAHFLPDKNEVLKTLWGLRLTDEVLCACGFNLEQKRKFVDHVRLSFQKEFGTNKTSLASMNAKYTKYKNTIQAVMGEQADQQYQAIAQIVKQKTAEMTPLLAELVRVRDEGQLLPDFFQLVSSFIHMMLNRLITHKERLHEMLVYEFLAKFYTTQYFLAKQPSHQPTVD